VAESGIERVVVAVTDPNPKVAGGGLARLRAAGLEIVTGVRADDALELIWPFVVTRAFDRPYVLLKTATSLDARFAPAGLPADRRPCYLTGAVARADVHRLRRWSDVVLVGGETARLDHPRLDTRLLGGEAACPEADPLPAVASRRPEEVAGFGERPWVLFTSGRQAASTPAPANCRVVRCEEREDLLDLRSLLGECGQHVGHTMLVEAGPTLASALLREDLVDRWVAYVAPVVLGCGATWPAGGGFSASGRFTLTRVERCGSDVKATFDRQEFAAAAARLASGGGR
jgi:diaminohydroxyphosphoribosylaminopyrimidine deaminase/5-amino-6-(5-phosphoribosylamino)uracil reductase